MLVNFVMNLFGGRGMGGMMPFGLGGMLGGLGGFGGFGMHRPGVNVNLGGGMFR